LDKRYRVSIIEYKNVFIKNYIKKKNIIYLLLIITVAVTEGLVREEQLLHDLCLLGAMTMEITQILTRAGILT
jgi:hypothetical protein